MLMEDLYTSMEPEQVEYTYPVLVTPCPDGTAELTMPDFPEINCSTENLMQGLSELRESLQEEMKVLMQGLAELRESLQEEMKVCPYPPFPTPAGDIFCTPGQFVLQLCVSR